jgi:hypothetical protein
MVSIFSFGFMLMTPENPFPYFGQPVNDYVYQIPTSMQQNTVSKIDCVDTVNALEWLQKNMGNSTFLLTHRAFYGWAMLKINADQLILYEYDNPVKAANNIVQQGHNKIYLIWWINGQGWYGQPSVSSSFEEVYHSGEIAIYSYKIA